MAIDYIELPIIDSTNTWAKEHSDELHPDPLICITANSQTSGRGRYKRTWQSPPDTNLYATFCFYLPPTFTAAHNLAQVLSISTIRVLKKLGLKPKIKWPNDILLNGKKCAGMLCEISQPLAIIGIGLNINMQSCDEIDQPATSLIIESGQEFSILAIRNQLAEQFLDDLNLYLKSGFDPFFHEYEQNLAYLGETITCTVSGEKITGVFEKLLPDGRILMRLPDGSEKPLTEGP
ncbi:MAG: biotin--[acetyl-CoA-carboxylase] ligase [Chlamydiia bacterium]|nr:biotin--[acetyl-CoA-carboxylase] ligase [Chlamydiia bacterium]